MSKTPVTKNPQDPDTTGHSWDGIEEFNNPLPRWWLWTFYATIFWGLIYTILFPAWPLVSQATPGVLGFSTRENVRTEIAAVNERNAALNEQLASVQLASLTDNAELHSFAVNAGGAVFRNNCSQCHGAGAAGAVGYPNLLDDDWLWGGSIDEIAYTITHGIRNEQSPDTQWSQMPAFGEILTPEEIGAVVQHVLAISGQEHDAALATTGHGAGGVPQQLRRLPYGRRHGRPLAGRTQPDGRDLALRGRRRHHHRKRDLLALRRDARLARGVPSRLGPDPGRDQRGCGLRPPAGRRRIE